MKTLEFENQKPIGESLITNYNTQNQFDNNPKKMIKLIRLPFDRRPTNKTQSLNTSKLQSLSTPQPK